MLDDRPYMRQSSPRGSWSGVNWLLGTLLAIFLVQKAVIEYGHGENILYRYFYLTRGGIHSGYLWQLLTFQFFHFGWLHLGFNCLFIYFVGRQIEEDLGTAGFWKLYLISGAAGGLLQLGLLEFFPDFFGGFSTLASPFGSPVAGASAGASGLFAAFALLHPALEVYLLFLPIAFRAITLLWVDLAWAIIGILFPSGSNVANGAHLGGILYALGYVYWGIRGNPPPWQLLFARARVRAPLHLRIPTRPPVWKQVQKPAVERHPDEFMSEEVDPILDKISAHGIHSLTDRERRILQAARNRMAKRP